MKQFGPQVTINPNFREIRKQSLEGYFETCLVVCCDVTTFCLTGWKTKCEEKLQVSGAKLAIHDQSEHEPDPSANVKVHRGPGNVWATLLGARFTETLHPPQCGWFELTHCSMSSGKLIRHFWNLVSFCPNLLLSRLLSSQGLPSSNNHNLYTAARALVPKDTAEDR